MDGFFIIILLFFVLPAVMKSLRKTAKSSSKVSSQRGQGRPSGGTASRWNAAEFQNLKETLQDLTQGASSSSSGRSAHEKNLDAKKQRHQDYEARHRRIKIEAAKRARRLKAHDDSHGDTVEGRDMSDQNRNRTAGWGSRAGPGLLNTKSVLSIFVMGGILAYVMSAS